MYREKKVYLNLSTSKPWMMMRIDHNRTARYRTRLESVLVEFRLSYNNNNNNNNNNNTLFQTIVHMDNKNK